MPFACIFVPDFSVAAIARAAPELRAQAVAVMEGKPPLQKVCSANEEARQAGVCGGMTSLQAELCDGVVLRDRSQLQEAAAHQALLDCALSFSPRVEDAAADLVLLDIAGLEKLFGPPQKIARHISRSAAEMGLQTNVAVAPSIEAGILAAHGFSGVSIVQAGREAEFLGRLDVEFLFAGEKDCEEAEEILATLRRWGVRKIRDLAALPEVELSERLGQRGVQLHEKACGRGERMLVPFPPAQVFEEAVELEFPLVLLEPLAFLLARMLDQLCARLAARALAAQELCLELTLEPGSFLAQANSGRGGVFQRRIHLPVPMLEANTFLKLLQLDLKSHPPGAPVVKVFLHIEPAKPRPAQNDLFMRSSPEAEKLELTLARIANVVGEGYAGSPEILDTHRREAFAMRRFMPLAHASVQSMSSEVTGLLKDGQDSAGRSARPEIVSAFRIFRPPVSVRVKNDNGQPCFISAEKRSQISGAVLWAAGPWRCSGDWWEEDAWMHDEWDIAVQEKTGIALYRLVHDLIGGGWLLEGMYD
jgi:protein ImuB